MQTGRSAECFIGHADGVFKAREIERLEPQDRCDTEAVNRLEYREGWRTERWTADRPEVRVDPFPIPPLPFEGVQRPKGENHEARH